MSTLALVALKIGFLALIWIFIFYLAQVIRGDMFGRKVSAEELASESAAAERTSKRQERRKLRKERKDPKAAAKNRASRIVVTDGPNAGIWAPLPMTGAVLLGRSNNATIDIMDDYASSRHARVYDHDGVWVIEDLKSTNGTYVNGQQIVAPTIISPEDNIRIGRTHLALEV